ncbi:hypothetical protein U1Q18_013766 [Sarracenia purpurea var. burkii]
MCSTKCPNIFAEANMLDDMSKLTPLVSGVEYIIPGYCQPGYSDVLNHDRMDGDRKKLNEEIWRVCKNPSEPAHNVFDELPQPIPETKIKIVTRQEQDTVRELDFPQTWASVVAKNGNYRPNTGGSRLNHRRPHSSDQ